jgi:hypothetical protein
MTSSRVTSGGRAGSNVSPGDREVLRLAAPVALWWTWLAFVAVNVADYAVQGLPSARFGSVVSAILLLVTALAYVLALRPRVVLDGSGLTVLNPFRIHHVPWSRITSVDTAEWVRVHYGPSASGRSSASGSGDRKVHCWALYVSARAKRKIARRAGGSGSSPGSSSRMPDEAKYLASLPVAKAIAIRLDTRARRERTREPAPPAALAAPASPAVPPVPDVVARWSWSSVAVAVVPVLILVVVALV